MSFKNSGLERVEIPYERQPYEKHIDFKTKEVNKNKNCKNIKTRMTERERVVWLAMAIIMFIILTILSFTL